MDKSEALYEGLKKVLNYLPMVYEQQKTMSKPGEIVIRYPYKSIPKDALLFVLPFRNSITIEGNTDNLYPNKLTICFAEVSSNGEISYNDSKTYNIIVEDINGSKRKAISGDIIANRLCMFRFISNTSSEIILCNNPIYNNLSCSTLSITNDANFYTVPSYMYASNGTYIKKQLALNEDLDSLEKRVTKLEERFKFGTETPEEYFNNNNVEDGTIYMQVEE